MICTPAGSNNMSLSALRRRYHFLLGTAPTIGKGDYETNLT